MRARSPAPRGSPGGSHERARRDPRSRLAVVLSGDRCGRARLPAICDDRAPLPGHQDLRAAARRPARFRRRRGEGTPEVKGYTFPALVCTDKTIRERPQLALAAVQAVSAAQKALKEDPARATAIGERLFPPAEAQLIAELIRRDAPYYQHGISRQTVESMNRFAQDLGLLSRSVSYDEVVWTPD